MGVWWSSSLFKEWIELLNNGIQITQMLPLYDFQILWRLNSIIAQWL